MCRSLVFAIVVKGLVDNSNPADCLGYAGHTTIREILGTQKALCIRIPEGVKAEVGYPCVLINNYDYFYASVL